MNINSVTEEAEGISQFRHLRDMSLLRFVTEQMTVDLFHDPEG